MLYLYGHRYCGNSYGIRCEYELVRLLNEQGIPVKLLFGGHEIEIKDFSLPEQYRKYCRDISTESVQITPEDTVIYTEADDDNPLGASHVIRWLLNKPFVNMAGGRAFGEKDIVAAYSYYVDKDLPQLFCMVDERELFDRIRKNAVHSRDKVCIYFGKYSNDAIESRSKEIRRVLSRYRDVTVITRNYPRTREECLSVIGSASLLISTDPLSNINFESCLVGTPVWLVDDAYDTQNRPFNIASHGVAYAREQIEGARAATENVYKEYCVFIENQPENVAAVIRQLIEKTGRADSDPQYLQENKELNLQKNREFEEYYREVFNATPMSYIAHVSEIPVSTRRKMGLTGRISFMKENFTAWKSSIMDTDSYGLTFAQLSYLMIRRIARRK